MNRLGTKSLLRNPVRAKQSGSRRKHFPHLPVLSSISSKASVTREQLQAALGQLREELEVERIALEAEHRALVEAQRELEVSRDRYADLVDFAPLGFATMNTAGAIKNLNITGARMLGWERSFLLGRPMLPLVATESRREFLLHLAAAKRSSTEVKAELWFNTKKRENILLEFTSILDRDAWDGYSGIRTAFRDVTQQHRAEQAASLARAQLSLMSDLAPVMLARCSRELRYSFVNQAFAQFLGRPREEIIGKAIAEIMGPAAFQAIRPHVDEVLQGRKVEYEMAVPYAFLPQPRFVRVAYTPERNECGEVIGWVAAISDITDRRQAESALREVNDRLEERVGERTAELQALNSVLKKEMVEHKRDSLMRDRLANIVKSSTDAIVSQNLKNILTSWNKAAERIFGYSADEAVGRSTDLIVPPDRRNELRSACQRLRQGQTLAPFETVRVRKDGTHLDVLVSLSPIKNSAGRVTGIAAVERDVSERRKAERALRESENRAQAVMDNSPAMIFLKDLDGRYLHVNRRFGELCRLSPEEIVGKTDHEIFPAPQAALFRANDLKMLQSRSPMVFNEVAQHPDGSHTGVVCKFPLFDLHGQLYGLGGIVTDVTQRKRLEEEVVRISEFEQERIARDLHDGLGQHLAGTWCLSDTLSKALAAQSSPEASVAAKIVDSLEAAVGQVRNLARGLSPVPPEPRGLMIALEALAAQCSELFAIRCRFVCPQPVLIRDVKVAGHLYRIAQEAVNNAKRHGKAKKIVIRLAVRRDNLTLRIVDDGIGFKESAKTRGSLGLQTMSYRADIIGAVFTIQNRPGAGTAVACRLPMSKGKANGEWNRK